MKSRLVASGIALLLLANTAYAPPFRVRPIGPSRPIEPIRPIEPYRPYQPYRPYDPLKPTIPDSLSGTAGTERYLQEKPSMQRLLKDMSAEEWERLFKSLPPQDRKFLLKQIQRKLPEASGSGGSDLEKYLQKYPFMQLLLMDKSPEEKKLWLDLMRTAEIKEPSDVQWKDDKSVPVKRRFATPKDIEAVFGEQPLGFVGPLWFDPPQADGVKGSFTNIPTGYAGDVLVRNVENLKAARTAAPKSLVVVSRSKNPEANLMKLKEKPQSLTIVHDFPQTAEAAMAIHGQKVTKSQLKEVLSARKQLEEGISRASYRVKHTDLALLEGPMSIAERVKTILANNRPGHLVVLVGHISGGSVRFHDKSALPIEDIPHGGQVWVLGCRTIWDKLDGDGLDLATGRAIRYSDASDAIAALAHEMDKEVDYRAMALTLQNLEVSLPPVPATKQKGYSTKEDTPKERSDSHKPNVPAGFAVMLAENDVLIFNPMDQAA